MGERLDSDDKETREEFPAKKKHNKKKDSSDEKKSKDSSKGKNNKEEKKSLGSKRTRHSELVLYTTLFRSVRQIP